LRIYRGKQISPGRVSIRKNRYPYQPGDTVLYLKGKYTVKWVQNLGTYIKLTELNKLVKTSEVHILHYGKGLSVYAS
jgi:hypothetical protein